MTLVLENRLWGFLIVCSIPCLPEGDTQCNHPNDSCFQGLKNVGETEPKRYCLSRRCVHLKTSETEPSGEEVGQRLGSGIPHTEMRDFEIRHTRV